MENNPSTQIPVDLAAEISVIGSMILEPTCIDDVALAVSSPMFSEPRHQVIFSAMLRLHCSRNGNSIPVDSVTLHNDLKTRKLLDDAGGMEYLGQVLQSVPSAANVLHYAASVREKWQLRSVMQICHDGLREASDQIAPAVEIVDSIQARVGKVAEQDATAAARMAAEHLPGVLAVLHGECDPAKFGVKTGLQSVDEIIGGMRGGEVIIIGSHTNHGKTALGLNFMADIAIGQGKPVAICSMEMTNDEVTERLVLARSRLGRRAILAGNPNAECQDRLNVAVSEIQDAKILIDDTGRQTIPQIRAKARAWKRRYGISCLMLDYVQLIEGENRKENRREQLVEISRNIKLMAKEVDVPILAICQLNRESAKEDRLPHNWDLAECAALERDANVIMLLDREAVRKKNDAGWQAFNPGKKHHASLQISKNRGGELAMVDLHFNGYCVRFCESISIEAQQSLYEQGAAT